MSAADAAGGYQRCRIALAKSEKQCAEYEERIASLTSRAEKAEARVAELEAVNQRLRAEAESRESDLAIARQIASESGRHRARVAELEGLVREAEHFLRFETRGKLYPDSHRLADKLHVAVDHQAPTASVGETPRYATEKEMAEAGPSPKRMGELHAQDVARRARLDADKTAKPLTEIAAVVPRASAERYGGANANEIEGYVVHQRPSDAREIPPTCVHCGAKPGEWVNVPGGISVCADVYACKERQRPAEPSLMNQMRKAAEPVKDAPAWQKAGINLNPQHYETHRPNEAAVSTCSTCNERPPEICNECHLRETKDAREEAVDHYVDDEDRKPGEPWTVFSDNEHRNIKKRLRRVAQCTSEEAALAALRLMRGASVPSSNPPEKP